MPKQNKIIVCVATDDTERRRMIQRLAVKFGLALTAGDANKLIKQTPYDYDLSEAYQVLALNYNLNTSPSTTHQLYRMATQGIAVIVGVKKLQTQYEFMSETYYQGEI